MRGRLAGSALALALAAVALPAAEVVVLRGGERIELKAPYTVQGSNAILTRADGVVLSVPMSEIDVKATAAARKAVPARPNATVTQAETPAEALRASKSAQKAKVRVTDADVSHDSLAGLEGGGATGEKKDSAKGTARLDVAGYDQSKAGGNLIVRGSLRNFGGTTASNSRMSVSAIDENGEIIGTGEASLSKGNLDSFETVAFTAAIPVGDKVIASLRFAPQWVAAPLPAPAAEAAAAGKSAASAAGAAGAAPAAAAPNQPPAPQPTPYGQGSLYAAPAPNAATTAPADSRQGYIPGASDPASQPKPPQ